MKKQALTIAIILGLGLSSFANPNGGGVFQRGDGDGRLSFREGVSTPSLPAHGLSVNQPAPIGSGIVLLTTLGAAYLIGKRRKKK